MNGYSPMLSLVTGSLEVALAIWAFRSPGRANILRPIGAMLLVLAGYQFIEVLVCARPSNPWTARLAFCDIVWLPPLGQWILFQCAGGEKGWIRKGIQASFIGAGLLCVWVLIDHSFVVGAVCQTVLATYEHGTHFHHIFGVYYELGLGAIIVGAALAMVNIDDVTAKAHCADLQLGVLAFMIPALFTQIVWKGLDPSIPSIMCHYAIILAVLMGRMVWRERSS